MENIKCPYCDSVNIATIDNESLDNNSHDRATAAKDSDHLFLDTEIYAQGKCFDCKESFRMEGAIKWKQPAKY
jgi:DNA-directed RNA polymerase subunit RPC12/RpoP